MQVHVSPNPFSEYIQINLLFNKDDNVSISLYNQLGKIIKNTQHQIYNGHNSIRLTDVSDLPNNTYYLLVETESCKEIIKMVKSR